jgi:hypothetical protein
MANKPPPPQIRTSRAAASRGLLLALGCAIATTLGPAAHADGIPGLDQPNAVSTQLQLQRLGQLLRAKLPEAPPETIDRAARDFLDHLRQASPLAAEQFSAGKMDGDDLSSRVDVFLGDHPELSGSQGSAGNRSPRMRVAELLGREPGIAQNDQERLALADRFIERLGELSETAHDNLMSGRMTQDELQSRVTVFASDTRAERSEIAADPATAAVPAIVESFEKANLGPVTGRPDAICFRGVLEEKGTKRDLVIFKKRPNKLRIHVVEDGLVIGVLGFDGNNSWREVPGKPAVPLAGAAADALSRSAPYDDPLVGYRERGADVRLEGRPGDEPIRLRIVETDGTTRVATIDPITYEETSLRTVRSDGRWFETRFRDYRRVGNLNVAYVQEQWDNGALRSTTRITDVSLDPGLLDRFFAFPSKPDFGFMDFMGGLAVMQIRAKQGGAQAPGGGRP